MSKKILLGGMVVIVLSVFFGVYVLMIAPSLRGQKTVQQPLTDTSSTQHPFLRSVTNSPPSVPIRDLPIAHDVVQKDFAPDFTLKSLDGREITLSSYRGQKPVVLDFFATGCHNCRRDMPGQQKLYDIYKDRVEVIAINLQENIGTVERYVARGGFTFPVVMDDDGQVSKTYGVRFTNTHVLINKDGTIQEQVLGDIAQEHFQKIVP